MPRKTRYLVWLVILISASTLFLVWNYHDYRLTSRTLPPGMTMAGLDVGGMTPAQAINALEVAFATPLDVSYVDHAMSLSPHTVDLQFDPERTSQNLEAALAERQDLEDFISHVLRQEHRSVRVPVAVTYSEERLSRFLDRVADAYDGPPQEPAALPATLDFEPGRPGTKLDVEASRDCLAGALLSAAERKVDLVVDVEGCPPQDLTLLRRLLQSRLASHPELIAGVFVKDLESGDELAINGDLPFAGTSVLKIALLEEVYRSLDGPPGVETTNLISETVIESGNLTANLLLRDVIGEGDGDWGMEKVTASMKRLGLVSTYVAAPYDEVESGLGAGTPAHSRSGTSTETGRFMQTTPLDVGMLLEMIYQCSHGGGTLIMTYPDGVTVEECQQMVEWLGRNEIDSLIEAGLPNGAHVVHEHGWTSETYADAGIVFGPKVDFVLVVFLHGSERLERAVGASLMTEVATATYRYFNTSW